MKVVRAPNGKVVAVYDVPDVAGYYPYVNPDATLQYKLLVDDPHQLFVLQYQIVREGVTFPPSGIPIVFEKHGTVLKAMLEGDRLLLIGTEAPISELSQISPDTMISLARDHGYFEFQLSAEVRQLMEQAIQRWTNA